MIVTLSANPQLIGQQIASALTTPSMPLSIISQAETKWTTIAQTLITNFQATGTIPNASTLVLGLVSPDGTTTTTSSNGVLSVPMATTSSPGIVKPDNSTIVIINGMITATTTPATTATSSILGISRPDNTTITVSSGILSAATATLSSLGIVEPDGTTITISAGVISTAAALIMLPRDGTSRLVVNVTGIPAQGAWSGVIQVTGNVGVPTGAKAILAEVVNFPYSSNAGATYTDCRIGFSDNGTVVPDYANSTPISMTSGYTVNTGYNLGNITEMIIPLNGSGQFYIYTLYAQQVTVGNCQLKVRVRGYLVGGISI